MRMGKIGFAQVCPSIGIDILVMLITFSARTPASFHLLGIMITQMYLPDNYKDDDDDKNAYDDNDDNDDYDDNDDNDDNDDDDDDDEDDNNVAA